MNYRRGALGSGLLYFVFLLIVFMIVGGIYGGLIAFFGKGYDYRFDESISLSQEVKECFVREGFFDLTTELDKNVFLEKCKISGKVLEDGEHLIYMKNKNGVEFSIGVDDFKNRCFFSARFRNRDLPLCVPLESVEGDYLLVGSSQNSRRVVA